MGNIMENQVISYYEIVCKTYHNTPVMRLRYCDDKTNEIVESQLYTPAEVTNLLLLWKIGDLCGSFGIGTVLSDNARFILCED